MYAKAIGVPIWPKKSCAQSYMNDFLIAAVDYFIQQPQNPKHQSPFSTYKSGQMDKLEIGDLALADKGFTCLQDTLIFVVDIFGPFFKRKVHLKKICEIYFGVIHISGDVPPEREGLTKSVIIVS